jgi:phosphatidylglycerophosphate synthase
MDEAGARRSGFAMIDGLYKKHIDPMWDRIARPMARHFTANQVTVLGFAFSLLLCLAYAFWQSSFWFGIGLAFAFAADSLDGAVARLRAETSRFGGYLDAMTDRYQELAVLTAIAWVNGLWIAAFFVLTGTYLVSYAKARTAIEISISNSDWPDLMERQERVIYTCVLLVAAGLFGTAIAPWFNLMEWGLWLLAALTHATAIQRFMRARRLLMSSAEEKQPR